jgi:predicted metal-dependent peptidase
MKITPLRIHALIAELIDDNPFACRALLQIVSTEFTTDVPTAAVTCGGEPRLLLNPEFLERHCQTEAHVKAVICHEFLHVLLRHTEGRGAASPPAEHLALDAVINAIIHRDAGRP